MKTVTYLKNCIVLAVGFAGLLLSAPIRAESGAPPATNRFKLDEGKGYPVCVQLLRSLNALPATQPPPVCELSLPERDKRYREPMWEPLDWRTNLPMIHKMEQFIAGSRATQPPLNSFEAWRDVYVARVEKEKLEPRLRRTKIALNSLGPETLLAYSRDTGACKKAMAIGGLATGGDVYFVQTADEHRFVEGIHGLGGRLESFAFTVANHTYFIETYQGASPWEMRLYRILPPLPPNFADANRYYMQKICHISLSK